MPGTDPPPAAGLLPDGVHASVPDGASWPRSRDVAAELPGLISRLSEHLGPIARAGLDSAAWDGLPTRLVVDGRVVHIDASSVGDDTVLVTRGDQDLFSLLVVPPDTPPDAARAAMAQAVRGDNLKGAGQILGDTGAEPLSPPAGSDDTEQA